MRNSTPTEPLKQQRVADLPKRALRFLDRHPTPFVIAVFGGGMLVGYLAAAQFAESPVLLERMAPDLRRDLYGSLAATSGALLGFAITSLAVLFALPRSDVVERLRKFRAWTLLNQSLLVAAALLAFALIFSTLALAIDTGSPGCLWLQIPVASFSIAAIAELLVAGAGFAMVIWEIAQRGEGEKPARGPGAPATDDRDTPSSGAARTRP